MVHACAQRLYPTSKSIEFSKCLLHSYQLVPREGFLLQCARDTGLDFEEINKCSSDISEEGGLEMVRRSFQKAEELGVKRSATIRLDGAQWCIRDDGQWKECKGGLKELVKEIREKYNAGRG